MYVSATPAGPIRLVAVYWAGDALVEHTDGSKEIIRAIKLKTPPAVPAKTSSGGRPTGVKP